MAIYEFDELVFSEEVVRLAADAMWILPVSAVEQHGPHLPAGTDAFLVEAIKEGLSQQFQETHDLVWLPHLKYGTSDEHLSLKGPTMSLQPETLSLILGDLYRSVTLLGVERLVILNGHGGNVPTLQASARTARVNYDLRVDLLRPLATLIASGGSHLDLHAGRNETALMSYLYPEYVDLDRVPDKEEMDSAFTSLFKQLSHDGKMIDGWITEDFSGNGVLGSPHEASLDQGERLFNTMLSACHEQLNYISRPSESV